jgi:hypothetical protein
MSLLQLQHILTLKSQNDDLSTLDSRLSGRER